MYLFISLLLITYTVLSSFSITHAQLPSPESDEQIPSDLSLDLSLAEQNPAPAQKKIADIQTEKAQITTSNGEQIVIPVQETVPKEIKTQSAKDTVNVEQTTSEQVVEKNEQQPASQTQSSDNPSGAKTVNDSQQDNNQAGKSTIPGTNIQEPDDNAAPANPQPTPPNTTSEQPNTIPLENGVVPAPAPAPDVGSSPKDSAAPAVQGVSKGPTISWWQQLINRVIGILK